MKIPNPFSKQKADSGQIPVILAALHPEPAVVEYLSAQPDVYLREAYSVRGVMQALPGTRLVILDHLLSSPEPTIEVLQQTLVQNQIPVTTQADFLASPGDWVSRAQLTHTGAISTLPSKQVNLLSWSGGVGETTLALAIARRFVERTGLPAAVLEICQGPGAICTLVPGEYPDFFALATHQAEPGKWQGVNLYPMDGRAFDVLWADDPVGIRKFLAEIRSRHTLLVVDGSPAHPLYPDLITPSSNPINLVICTPRADTIASGRSLLQDLPVPRHLILNRATSLVDASEAGIALRLPEKESLARSFDTRLADPLLSLIYPGWNGK